MKRHATAYAPGRVELLGNHTDYNGGLVLAAAIDRGVTVRDGACCRCIDVADIAIVSFHDVTAHSLPAASFGTTHTACSVPPPFGDICVSSLR